MASSNRFLSMTGNAIDDFCGYTWTIQPAPEILSDSILRLYLVLKGDEPEEVWEEIIDFPRYRGNTPVEHYIAMCLENTADPNQLTIIGSTYLNGTKLAMQAYHLDIKYFDDKMSCPAGTARAEHYKKLCEVGKSERLPQNNIICSFLNQCWKYSQTPEFWGAKQPSARAEQPDLELPSGRVPYAAPQVIGSVRFL